MASGYNRKQERVMIKYPTKRVKKQCPKCHKIHNVKVSVDCISIKCICGEYIDIPTRHSVEKAITRYDSGE